MTATDEAVGEAPPTTTAPPPPPPIPGTAVAVRERMTPQDRYAYAQSLAPARMLPGELRNSPADVLLRVEYGYSLGLPPIAAISAVHVVDGKPTASAGLMSAVVRAAGHRFRVWTEDDPSYPGEKRAIATIVRSDDPGFEYRVEWTIERAVAANLLRIENGKPLATKARSAWDTYRAGMLKARATTEVCRDAAEDVLLGVHYTAEELGAPTDAHGDVIEGEVVEDSAAPRPPAAAAPAAAPEGPTGEEPITDPDLVGSVMRDALSRSELIASLVELGLAHPDESVRGGFGYQGDVMKGIEIVVDVETGELADAWTAFAQIARDLPENPPEGGTAAPSEPDQPLPGTGGPRAPGTPERATSAPAGEWASSPVGTDAVSHPDDDGLPLDACHVKGCIDPPSHTTADHMSWHAKQRAAAQAEELGANGEPIVDADVVEDPSTVEHDPTDQGLPSEAVKDKTPAQIARAEARRAAKAAREAAAQAEADAVKGKPSS